MKAFQLLATLEPLLAQYGDMELLLWDGETGQRLDFTVQPMLAPRQATQRPGSGGVYLALVVQGAGATQRSA